jgi:hypothetical protein
MGSVKRIGSRRGVLEEVSERSFSRSFDVYSYFEIGSDHHIIRTVNPLLRSLCSLSVLNRITFRLTTIYLFSLDTV